MSDYERHIPGGRKFNDTEVAALRAEFNEAVKTSKEFGRSPNCGLKFDADKPSLSLLPFDALEEVAKVLDFGARKYDAHNWRKGMEFSRLVSAALRHISAWNLGEDNDPESGLNHLAHAACCILFLTALQKDGKIKEKFDDRWKK